MRACGRPSVRAAIPRRIGEFAGFIILAEIGLTQAAVNAEIVKHPREELAAIRHGRATAERARQQDFGRAGSGGVVMAIFGAVDSGVRFFVGANTFFARACRAGFSSGSNAYQSRAAGK